MDSVVEIFMAASTATSASMSSLQTRMKKALRSKEVEIRSVLRSCVDRVLLASTKDDVANKLIGFFGCQGKCLLHMYSGHLSYSVYLHYIAIMTEEVLAETMEHLCRRCSATDKVVRQRACQWMHIIIQSLEGQEIDEEVCQLVIKALLPRLNDKIATVRVCAIRAINKLTIFDEGGTIVAEMVRLMTSDANKDIRVAVLENVYVTSSTLPYIVERIKDIHAEVRIAAYDLLKGKVKMTHLKIGQRGSIVQFGLSDREPSVLRAAKDLLLNWLTKLDNSVSRLLSLMGLERNEIEAESLAHFIIQEADDESSTYTHLRGVVWNQRPDWSRGLSTLSASDLLWAQLRCQYALKNYAPATSADLVEFLAPDAMCLCGLIDEANTASLASSPQQQLIVRYLLRLALLMESSDVAGCQELEAVCMRYVTDLDTPDTLIEGVLSAWAKGCAEGEGVLRARVVLASRNLIAAARARTSPQAVSLMDDEDSTEESSWVEKSLLRSMELFTWVMQRGEGGRILEGVEHFAAILSLVLESLLQPIIALRILAVRCLGLLCISSEAICDSHREVLLQVARTDLETLEIRVMALQAVIDISSVYCDKFKDDVALSSLLLRVLDTGDEEPYLLRLAAEGAARLLFSGNLSEPRLFAQLTKIFFQPQLVPGALEEEGENLQNETFLGSPARLQQILSTFFQSFFIAGNGREEIALEAMCEIVSDVSALIRNDEADENSLQKVPN
jgi:hypothetical protein